MLCHLAQLLTLESASHFLKIAKDWPPSVHFYIQTNQFWPSPSITSFIELLHSGLLFSCHNQPKASIGQLSKIALMPQSPPKLLKLVNPKPAYTALPVPSYGNHNKGSCSHFLLIPSSLPLVHIFSFPPQSLSITKHMWSPMALCAPSFQYLQDKLSFQQSVGFTICE